MLARLLVLIFYAMVVEAHTGSGDFSYETYPSYMAVRFTPGRSELIKFVLRNIPDDHHLVGNLTLLYKDVTARETFSLKLHTWPIRRFLPMEDTQKTGYTCSQWPSYNGTVQEYICRVDHNQATSNIRTMIFNMTYNHLADNTFKIVFKTITVHFQQDNTTLSTGSISTGSMATSCAGSTTTNNHNWEVVTSAATFLSMQMVSSTLSFDPI